MTARDRSEVGNVSFSISRHRHCIEILETLRIFQIASQNILNNVRAIGLECIHSDLLSTETTLLPRQKQSTEENTPSV